ncbi:hypothetical protein [Nonomuraea sp. NPDC050691]|uniref:hypothetical protein n=1 Tax=Nonomuraea sp. NPDC050691 TaxID=3155661 RepID=UPI0033EEF39B
MRDVSLLDAWQLWLSGKSTLGTTLCDIPMIWWGRAGKLLSFFAAATVLLDVLGPERLKQYAERSERIDQRDHDNPDIIPTKVRRVWGCLAFVLVPPIIIFGLAGMQLAFLYYRLLHERILWPIMLILGGYLYVIRFKVYLVATVSLFASILEHRHFASVIRLMGFIALAVGFHFDLLAS